MKTKEYIYSVAGFGMSIRLPEPWDAGLLLPSFRPFAQDTAAVDTMLLSCTVSVEQDNPRLDDLGAVVEETVNDMGHIRLYHHPVGYRVVLFTEGSGWLHTMVATKDFTQLTVCLCSQDRLMGHMLSSFLRLAYSQAILYHDAVSIHASAVHNGGYAFLFLGKSGTGKSTHSSLWMKHIPGTGLLNDDNPTLCIKDGKAYAWGTPWSGKTPCYINNVYPVGGVVRLRQAAANSFHRQEGVAAFVALLPGCSVIGQDEALRSRLYDTVGHLAQIATVGIMDCTPHADAAAMCHATLDDILKQ